MVLTVRDLLIRILSSQERSILYSIFPGYLAREYCLQAELLLYSGAVFHRMQENVWSVGGGRILRTTGSACRLLLAAHTPSDNALKLKEQRFVRAERLLNQVLWEERVDKCLPVAEYGKRWTSGPS